MIVMSSFLIGAHPPRLPTRRAVVARRLLASPPTASLPVTGSLTVGLPVGPGYLMGLLTAQCKLDAT